MSFATPVSTSSTVVQVLDTKSAVLDTANADSLEKLNQQ